MKLPWWKQTVVPATSVRPEVHQNTWVAVAYCMDADCDHAWECVSDAYLGPFDETQVWIYMDVCRPCEAIRLRRVVQGAEAAVQRAIARQKFQEVPKREAAMK